jgi:hypothetical protein
MFEVSRSYFLGIEGDSYFIQLPQQDLSSNTADFVEYAEFILEMGMTALKAAN